LQLGFTADRYFVICHPLTFHSRRDSGYQKWIILACVAVSFLLYYLIRVQLGSILIASRLLEASWIIFGISIMSLLFILMKAELTKMVMIPLDGAVNCLTIFFLSNSGPETSRLDQQWSKPPSSKS
jgi:hypothetical protein